MSYYWAEFIQLREDVFRFDTRIYLNPINQTEKSDYCIGAVIGKNPGSAKAASINKGIQPIDLNGDKLLTTVRNIVLKSYDKAGIKPPQRGYIQVLNLFYLCNPKLEQAISALQGKQSARNCRTENLTFPWIWYVWGSTSKTLNPYKERFSRLKSENHFYYDKEKSTMVAEPASVSAFAKHTQGLRHDDVIQYIAGILKKA